MADKQLAKILFSCCGSYFHKLNNSSFAIVFPFIKIKRVQKKFEPFCGYVDFNCYLVYLALKKKLFRGSDQNPLTYQKNNLHPTPYIQFYNNCLHDWKTSILLLLCDRTLFYSTN